MKKSIALIGVPMNLGQGLHGVDLGPEAIRAALIEQRLQEYGYDVKDMGNVFVPPRPSFVGNPKLKHALEIQQVAEELASQVSLALQEGSFPLVLGGDHSIAIGTMAGVSQQYAPLGLIWVDAHGDLNTEETSPSGHIHGMSVAVGLGQGHPGLTGVGQFSPKVRPEHVAMVGIRELDSGERVRIKELGIRVFSMDEIDRRGITAVMEEAIHIASLNTQGVHLSFDLDSLDPSVAPGVGTPVNGGLTYHQARVILEMLGKEDILVSAEFVEVNPLLDDKNITAEITVSLVETLMGKKCKELVN